MIEFRASCGHTVRAKDSDAGNEIPCRYCGRMVRVPMPEATGLDQLLGPDDTGSSAPAQTKHAGRKRSASIDLQGAFGGPQVYRVAMFLVWGAVVVAVLVVGIKLASKNLAPLFRKGPETAPTAKKEDSPSGPAGSEDAGKPTSWERKRNLLAQLQPGRSGLLISSVPGELQVEIDWADQGRPLGDLPINGLTPMQRELPPGKYRVSVWIRSHDKRLLDIPGYGEWFKRVEENAAIPAKPRFFMEDEATAFTVEARTDGPWRFRREYEPTVEPGEWKLVAVPFLPDEPLEQQVAYLPREQQFELNSSQADEYLNMKHVEGEERRVLVKALERLGKAHWQDPTGMRYMFHVLWDGTVWAQQVGQTELEPLVLQLPMAEASHLAPYTVADLNDRMEKRIALATVVMLMEEYNRRGLTWPIDRLLRFLPQQRQQGDIRDGPDYDEWRSASGVDRLRFVRLIGAQAEPDRQLLDGLGLALQEEDHTAVALAIIELLSETGDRHLMEHLIARRQRLARLSPNVDRIVELTRLDQVLGQSGGE
jgi:hypothetical protein